MHLPIAAALAAQAAGPLCGDVARLVDGAREAVPFASLVAERFAPRLLGVPACSGHPRLYLCKRSLLPPAMTEARVAAQIAACLPDAKISVEKTGDWGFEKTIVRGSGLTFVLDESGADRGHVGRTLFVTLRPAGDPAATAD